MNPWDTTGPSIVLASMRPPAKVKSLAPKKFHVYSQAEAERESAIKRLNAEIEADHEASKNHTDMATYYRDRARTKARQVADLVASRPDWYVQKLQAERGI